MWKFVIYMPDGEFNRLSISELNECDSVDIHYHALAGKCDFVKWLFKIHKSVRINQLVHLPLKKFWGKIIASNHIFNDYKNDKICFIFHYSYYYFHEIGLFEKLKEEYPNCRLVFLFRDKVELLQKHLKNQNTDLDISYLKHTFDLILVYNRLDADAYGFTYYDDFDSKIEFKKSKNYPASDLFFAGTDKGRLNLLLQIFEKCKLHNLKCDFFITGVPVNKQIYKNEITYADKWMPYTEMLQRSVDSKCILELSQEGAVGYTSRAIEAFMYNKKLLTNSIIVKECPLINEEYVQFFQNPDNIDYNFLKTDNYEKVNYNYNGEFSPKTFLKFIEDNLPYNR